MELLDGDEAGLQKVESNTGDGRSAHVAAK